MKTVLMGHFERIYVKKGQKLRKGDKIGLMGNTGVSRGAHLHLAVANSKQSNIWWLADSDKVNVDKERTEKFINTKGLFSVRDVYKKAKITTKWLGYKNHKAIDAIAENAMFLPEIHWNQEFEGEVVLVRDDGDKRYGKVVLIQYKEDLTLVEIDFLAREVLAGKHGNGQDRVKSLGSAYPKVQARVNQLLNIGSRKSVEQVAKEVWQGKWGNGAERVRRLKEAGYNPEQVQREVNKGRR